MINSPQLQFPDVDDLQNLILSELPRGLFPLIPIDLINRDGNTVSSAEVYAVAQVLSDCYANLQDIYRNKFPITLGADGIADWNTELFSTPQDSTLSISEQIANIITKYQFTGGISYSFINSLLSAMLSPLDLNYDLCPWSSQGGLSNGGWMLGESVLQTGTSLLPFSPVKECAYGNVVDCSQNYAPSQMSADQFLDAQRSAYLYEVRIFGSVSSQLFSALDAFLTRVEPAHVSHIDPKLNRNLILSDYPAYGSAVNPVPYQANLFQSKIDFSSF